MDKGSGRTQGATDVWYFVQGLHSIVRLDTLPEKGTLSEKQPDPKEISHLGCRLCTYVIKCLNAISATDCLTEEVGDEQHGKIPPVKQQLSEIISRPNMEALVGYCPVAAVERLEGSWYIDQGVTEWRARDILTRGILRQVDEVDCN